MSSPRASEYDPEALVPGGQACRLLSMSRASFYRRVADDPDFPPPRGRNERGWCVWAAGDLAHYEMRLAWERSRQVRKETYGA